MPYRRLPNTDNARIRALRTAIEKNRPPHSKIITPDLRYLEGLLRNMEQAQIFYQESLATQVKENQKLQKLIKNARLYISHFIQVLNLAVIRHEIKQEAKQLYNLEPENHSTPDLSTNDALLSWGNNVIEGERKRISQGGVPIYNPTIARVNVAYSQFKTAHNAQKIHQHTTNRHLEALSSQRDEVDKILIVIWNEIEAFFSFNPADIRYEKCKEYGVVYYLRKGEQDNDN